jgi:hypothetical protein
MVDEEQVKLKALLRAMPPFAALITPAPSAAASAVPAPPVAPAADLLAPAVPYDQLFDDSAPPAAGSLVEAATEYGTVLGAVLEGLCYRFNERFNKLKVLCHDNRIREVSVCDVLVHFGGVLRPAAVAEMAREVLAQRHDAALALRRALAAVVGAWRRRLRATQRWLAQRGHFEVVYARHQRALQATPVLLADFVAALGAAPAPHMLAQCCVAMACHMQMVADAAKWLVPTALEWQRRANVCPPPALAPWAGAPRLNALAPPAVYLANLLTNHDAVEEMRAHGAADGGAAAARFLQALRAAQALPTRRSFIDLLLYMLLWEGAPHKWALDCMKLFVVYPHPSLRPTMARIVGDATPAGVHRFLCDLGVYTPDTDIYLSASLRGKPLLEQLSVAAETDLVRPAATVSAVDRFGHLRSRFYRDAVVYALPGGRVAVSVEQRSTRRYALKIHVADPAAWIGPEAALGAEGGAALSASSAAAASWGLWTPLGLKVPPAVRERFAFRTQNVAEGYTPVGDLLAAPPRGDGGGGGGGGATCMTISFDYQPFSNPFDDLGAKVSVGLSSLDGVAVKALSSAQLEAVLDGSDHATFRLFTRRAPTADVTERNRHDLRLILSVARTYAKARNARNAALAAAPDPWPYCAVMAREIAAMSRDFAAHYCHRHHVAVYAATQALAEPSAEPAGGDSVLLSHNNLLLPEFLASSYYHTLLGRDADGNVSAAARVAGYNFAGAPRLGAAAPLVTEGLALGAVGVDDALDSAASLINQYQLVSHLHLQHALASHMARVDREGPLRALGYAGAPWLAPALLRLVPRLAKELRAAALWQVQHYKWRRLRQLEALGPLRLQCVVTHVTRHALESYRLLRAYCVELGIEVEVLELAQGGATVGQLLECDRLVWLDAVEGRCVLGAAEGIHP